LDDLAQLFEAVAPAAPVQSDTFLGGKHPLGERDLRGVTQCQGKA
jgi:hypothetical protein